MINFNELNISKEIKKALNMLNYTIPTPVQDEVIPLALSNNNIAVQAKTGSGKTLAFSIPLVEKLDWNQNKPQALVLSPTRELALQIKDLIDDVGRLKRIKTVAVYGQHPIEVEKRQLKQKTHALIGTCGRVIDHLEHGRIMFEYIDYLVIDEADKMFDLGFKDDLITIISHIKPDTQVLLFSATLDNEVISLIEQYVSNLKIIKIKSEEILLEHNYYLYNKNSNKLAALNNILINQLPESCLIFANTKADVDLITEYLQDLNYPCIKLHGDMFQKNRNRAINAFKNHEIRFLIASDIAARGIDVEAVSLVINYDLPKDVKTYVHRAGRSGRAGVKGKVISLVNDNEMLKLDKISSELKLEITEIKPLEKALYQKNQKAFLALVNKKVVKKAKRNADLTKTITRLRLNIGKKKKLRAASFVGILTNIKGVEAEDIGAIDVLDTLTYIDILNGKGNLVVKYFEHEKISGKQIQVKIIK